MAIIIKNLDKPDEASRRRRGRIGYTIVGDSMVSSVVLQPGWSWDEYAKPFTDGDESCQMVHREYVISGRIRYLTDDGDETVAGPGDHLWTAPGTGPGLSATSRSWPSTSRWVSRRTTRPTRKAQGRSAAETTSGSRRTRGSSDRSLGGRTGGGSIRAVRARARRRTTPRPGVPLGSGRCESPWTSSADQAKARSPTDPHPPSPCSASPLLPLARDEDGATPAMTRPPRSGFESRPIPASDDCSAASTKGDAPRSHRERG